MTDLEKQIMAKREVENAVNIRRRTRTVEPPVVEANFFGTGDTSAKTISSQLKDFDNKYKPTDLTAMFSETITKTETKKVADEAKSAFSTNPKPAPKVERDPYAATDDEFYNITKMGRMPTEATYEVPVDTTEYNKNKFGIKLNLKGKLVVMVASVVFLCLLFLAIFNAVTIGNLNSDIADINASITTESELLNWIEKTYNEVTDENNINFRAEQYIKDNDLTKIPTIEFELIEETATQAAKTSTNWFDAFCNFMAKLFGAN